jgi:hypothetical protein
LYSGRRRGRSTGAGKLLRVKQSRPAPEPNHLEHGDAGMRSFRSAVERLARQAGVSFLPIEEWREQEWAPVVAALEGGASEVPIRGVRFTRQWYTKFVRAWDSFRCLQSAVALEELAGFVESRGDTCGLAAVLRQQGAEWRAKTAALEANLATRCWQPL